MHLILTLTQVGFGRTDGLRETTQKVASPVGIEPTTCGLEVRCSIQLGYGLVVRL